ncbi:Pentatricopeptide repeat-containing protein, chloroplastic [Vitis vinifera]|uniref:Pentatricopeptide repeat-containing protein, chloroplastic n=1 Tax=Vitis vinifera TaxID=29760 RepID=A0A438H6R8_VITVI|nr:Pentatricopeptide repeat-containing protein, chloroplastic [Vitis vinifera]
MSRQLQKILVCLTASPHDIKVFDQVLTQTITTAFIHATPTWNCLIRAYSRSPTPITAILIYNHFIKGRFVFPDKYTYPAMLKACWRMGSLSKGKEVHAHVTKTGLDSDVYVGNALLHLYGSTGQVTDARRMMYEGIGADHISMVIVFSACGKIGGTEFGKECGEMDAAQSLFVEMAAMRDVVSHTILFNGYVDMGSIDLARGIFDQMSVKDLVSWNSMIHAYVKAKHPKKAIELFRKMENEMVEPDETTMVSVLAACASLADLQNGRLVHRFILQNNPRQDLFVGTALIDMYAKCGSLEEAMVTFYKMDSRDVFTWTTAIEGLANHGHGDKALSLFTEMEKQGIKPNQATFVSILMACSRSGLVKEGCLLFKRMVEAYQIQPKIEHLGCLLDILSRAGLLHQAQEFIKLMPPEEKIIANKTLLSACMNHLEYDLGEKIANGLTELSSQSHATHILLSNFYALAGQWAEVAKTRRVMKETDIRKVPGISSVDIKT